MKDLKVKASSEGGSSAEESLRSEDTEYENTGEELQEDEEDQQVSKDI